MSANIRRKDVMMGVRGVSSTESFLSGLAIILVILRIRKNETKKVMTGNPLVIQLEVFPVQPIERVVASCQTRKAIHALTASTDVPMIMRVMPRNSTKPAHTAKMTSAAVPRLICGMVSGDTVSDEIRSEGISNCLRSLAKEVVG